MATFASLLTWSALEVELKEYLGIMGDTSEDTQLQLWFAAAAANADSYTENDDYEDLASVPVPIKLGCYEYVKALRDYWGYATGLAMVKTGQLQESYRAIQAANAAVNAARAHWRPYLKGIHRE